MTRYRNVEGNITETTGGSYKVYSKKNIETHSHSDIIQTGKAKGVSFGEPQKPRIVDTFFIKGWWALDLEGKKIIKKAIPEMSVYFHLETKNIPDGQRVYLTLMEDDNSEPEELPNKGSNSRDKDEKITLVTSSNQPETRFSIVSKSKIVMPIFLTNLKNFLDSEVDKCIELYFRCSYSNQNTHFPSKVYDYLRVKELVVDRYKVPGLNEAGTDIASDLTYGFGIKNPSNIYSATGVQTYIQQYTENGPLLSDYFDAVSNRKDIKGVNKTKYSKEECYNTKYVIANPKINSTTFNIPLIGQVTTPAVSLPISISTGFDVRVFDTFSNDVLFWDFEQTASLYFAKGNLEGNLKRMIAYFKANKGGIYQDAVLTAAIKSDSVTTNYCNKVEKYLSNKIKQNSTDLHKIEDKKPNLGNSSQIVNNRKSLNKNFTRPIYNSDENKTGGLTIALNDIWATQITVKQLKNKGNNYTCKYEVVLWDHFGLDIPDMEKIFNIIPSVGETFVTWFILQHLRGYKPFITKMVFEKEFSGTF